FFQPSFIYLLFLLAFFTQDTATFIVDPLTFVRLWAFHQVNFRSHLTDFLLVNARDFNLGGLWYFNLDALWYRELYIMAEAKLQNEIFTLQSGTETNAFDDQLFAVTFDNAFEHATHQGACCAPHVTCMTGFR